jgi:hypothetical protein
MEVNMRTETIKWRIESAKKEIELLKQQFSTIKEITNKEIPYLEHKIRGWENKLKYQAPQK